MKIGILTLPLHYNYGGLLQAYALQLILRRQGHEVFTVDFVPERVYAAEEIKRVASLFIQKYVLWKDLATFLPKKNQEKRAFQQHTDRFIAQNISITQRISCLNEFDYIKPYDFDAFVVGSDQVWRPAYAQGLSAYFLRFLGDDTRVKRIAYAASFGLDHCREFSGKELSQFSDLIRKFDAVGVREDSAVRLCREFFGVDAEHLLDPTMLLEPDDYRWLVERDRVPKSAGNMMVYVLDSSVEKQKFIDQLAQKRGLKVNAFKLDSKNAIYPPVTRWLRGFMDAEYVVTDSFHGILFAILFNKPFLTFGNSRRGMTRFDSILKKMQLLDRMVCEPREFDPELVARDIDYSKVNAIRREEVAHSLDFLRNALANSHEPS